MRDPDLDLYLRLVEEDERRELGKNILAILQEADKRKEERNRALFEALSQARPNQGDKD